MNSITQQASSHAAQAVNHIAAVKVFQHSPDAAHKSPTPNRGVIGNLHNKISLGLQLAKIEAALEQADATWALVLAVQNARADVVGAIGDLREDVTHATVNANVVTV